MTPVKTPRRPLEARLERYERLLQVPRPAVAGRLVRVVGLALEAQGCRAPIGSLCRIEGHSQDVEAEVVGFGNNTLYLMPNQDVSGILPGARVTPLGVSATLPVGMSLLGRVVDGLGRPLDGLGPVRAENRVGFKGRPLNPLTRRPIRQPLDVGVRAINTLLTVGQGQRMGLFAGSGVGKSVLLGMMTKGTSADVIVVGLVGERGREVREFIDEILGEEGRRRAVVVAAPADTSPLMRLKACETALTFAEYFRDQGLNVLLLVDSLTRYAQAQREIALAVGEPPATKGYPPSVFARLPGLVERAGNGGDGQGGITAFFTVLSEGDDLQDPIADAARAILDGHIVLSRALADSGHYPAIDVGASVSRVMPQVTSEAHQLQARRVKSLFAAYEQSRDLIQVGAYRQGSDPKVDLAIRLKEPMNLFLRQAMQEVCPYDDCLQALDMLAKAAGEGA
ncbi:flagellar protein export ATPase FliI [Gallaecimonas xiamenensis]|uniref:Flagellum-specific ATP synthase n=1 Tax=Gallaecimonas xiamenensis 3-C-1 TaxID=745411 RepID=K2JLW6_9GAMM|nr:flagellar protein export ATPase FliI [Gallaecimonas xiamenensis]EKE75417.1 flagellum-specific ATP synthase [Gallaecimonas xiamenensis 3-C-1]